MTFTCGRGVADSDRACGCASAVPADQPTTAHEAAMIAAHFPNLRMQDPPFIWDWRIPVPPHRTSAQPWVQIHPGPEKVARMRQAGGQTDIAGDLPGGPQPLARAAWA